MKGLAVKLHRRKACLFIVIGAALPALAHAEPPDEKALRERVAQYMATWSRRDVASWVQLHTDDVHYVDVYLFERRGRDAIATYFPSVMALYDLDLTVVRMRVDGEKALVVLRSRYSELPMRDGKYVRVLDREPVLSHWRKDGGIWRVDEFIDSTTVASERMKAEGLN